MLKPDFGQVDVRIDWTDDRVAYVRHLAEQGMSASAIAVDIGLSANHAPRIFELCKRHDIRLTGRGGRPRQDAPVVVYRVAIHARNAEILDRLAKRHSLYAGRVAEILLNAAFETGEPFCENLMDLDAGT
jgi:hypothetical protein